MVRSKREKMKGRKNSGSFLAIPKSLLTSPAFSHLSGNALKALFLIAANYNGKNNGDLHASYKIAKTKGWRSNTTFSKALKELVEKGFIIQTKQGSYPNKFSLYALTWFQVDPDFEGKYDAGIKGLIGNVPNTWKSLSSNEV